jgi:hypothetical protein
VLDDMGETVNTGQEITALFDSLDDSQGNVSFTTQADGTVLFDVRIQKELSGETELATSFLGDLVDVDAVIRMTGTVHVHVVIGVDAEGFLIDVNGNKDANGNSEPEIAFDNMSGTVQGLATLGFLEVELKESPINVNPNVRFIIDVHDPGTDGVIDNKLRLEEMDDDLPPEFVTIDLLRDPNATEPDLEVEGTFSVAGFNVPLFTDVRLDIRWPSILDLSQGQVVPHIAEDGVAAKILDFLSMQGPEIVSTVRDLATHLEASTGQNFLQDKKIPILNKTIGELLNAVDNSLTFSDQQVVFISPVYEESSFQKFQIKFSSDVNLVAQGVGVSQVGREGGTIRYLSGGQIVEADIDRVESDRLTIRFPLGEDKTPDAVNPVLTVSRGGSIFDQINGLADGFSFEIPTLQELIDRIEAATGFTILDGVEVVPSDASVGNLNDAYIKIPIDFELEPFEFTHRIDLGERIQSLNLQGQADFQVTVTPEFHIPLGIRLNSGLTLPQRFFLPEDDVPEVLISAEASFIPSATGSIGFLDIALGLDDSVANNKGIVLTTDLAINLTDPGTGADDDGAIKLAEIAGNLANVFQVSANGSLDIDGLKLVASLDDTIPIGHLTISLEGEGDGAPGQISSLNDFARLINPGLGEQGIVVNGQLDAFESFANIGPEQIFQALQFIIDQLRETGRGGAFDVDPTNNFELDVDLTQNDQPGINNDDVVGTIIDANGDLFD